MNCQEYQQLFEEAPCYITVQGKDLKIIRSKIFEKIVVPTIQRFMNNIVQGNYV